MHSGNRNSSGKARFIRIGCVLLLLCLALSGCGQPAEEKAEDTAAPVVSGQEPEPASEPAPEPTGEPVPEPTAWDTAFETGNGYLEEFSLLPENLTEYTIGLMPGEESQLGIAGDPVRTDENGIRYYAVTEELAQGIVQLRPVPQSVGPDGTVLWFISNREGSRGMFIQRDQTFLSVHVSKNRGGAVADEDEYTFMQRMSSVYCDTFEWSADGRYVFYNNWNRWHNFAYDRMMLPFLLDAHTGEVFLLFSLPGLNQIPNWQNIRVNGKDASLLMAAAEKAVSCGTWDGHFSRDGRYLYLLMYGVRLPGWESPKALMRYDLETGRMEQCCWLPESADSFWVMGDNRLLVCCTGDTWQFVTADDSGFTVTPAEGFPAMASYPYPFRNGLNDSDTMLICSNAFAFISDQAESVDEWFVMESPEEGIRKITTRELIEPGRAYYYFDSIVPVRNTPYVILYASGFRLVAESWTPITEHEYRMLLLDTNTMAVQPLGCEYYYTLPNTHNGTVSGDLYLGENITYRLNPDRQVQAEETQAEETAAKTKYWLECWNAPADEVRESFRIRNADYSYQCVSRSKSGPPALKYRNNTRGRTEGFSFDSDIRVLDDRYLLAVRLRMNLLKENVPKYVIPPVLTEERYAEVIEKNNIDATRKETVSGEETLPNGKKIRTTQTVDVSMYEKVSPEDLPERPDAETLALRYPSITERPLYILTDDVTPEDKQALEKRMKGIYTLEDYWQDFELTSGSRWSDATSPLTYVIHSDNPDIQWIQGPAIALCTLSDRLGSAVYKRYASADPKPESVESLALDGRYEVIDIPWQVSLESVQEEGDELTVVFSVVPEDEYGMFPVGNETGTAESE